MKLFLLVLGAAILLALPFLFLAGCSTPAEIPRATHVAPPAFRHIVHPPTPAVPVQWTEDIEISRAPAAAQTLHHQGRTVAGVPEVWLNGIPVK